MISRSATIDPVGTEASMDFVFVIDEIASLQPGHDSSVALMEAAQRRGHRILVTTAAGLGFADGHATASCRPVSLRPAVLHDGHWIADPQWFSLGPRERYRLDDAVARANASDLALGASVWSADEDRAVPVAGRLEAGTVWVNQHPLLSPDVPFGGLKQSGLGVESSRYGLLAYTDISVLRVRR